MELHRFDVIVIDKVSASVLSFVNVNSLGSAEREVGGVCLCVCVCEIEGEVTGNLESSYIVKTTVQSYKVASSVDENPLIFGINFHILISIMRNISCYMNIHYVPPSIYVTMPVVLPPYRCHFTTNIAHIIPWSELKQHYVLLRILFTFHWAVLGFKFRKC